MDTILSKPHYRRTFFIVVLLVLVLALVARFFVLPCYDSTLSLSRSGVALLGALLDNLVISLLLTVFLGGFVFWLTPAIVKRSAIEVIAPKEINPLLKAAVHVTRSWIYKGACGRYTRAETIPGMAKAARTEGIGRDITICILNPKNDDLCAAYATYRKSLKSSDAGKPWSCQVVQEEIIATAITALRFQFSEPLLRIRVFFVDHFSAFRFDISDQYVVTTKEDKGASALRADAGTYFYDSYKDDVRLTERQSKEMVCCGKLDFPGLLDEAKLKEAMKCADLFDESKITSLNMSRILESVNTPKDPY